MFVSSEILPSVGHDDHMDRVFNKSQLLAKFTGYFMWTRHPGTFFLNKVFTCCQKNSMMSVFWSNTLIFAPECWKYILRGPVFKFFPEACTFSGLKSRLCHTFFSSPPFDTYLILLKTLYRPPKTAILMLKIYWILHFIERNWKLISVMYVPQITICLISIIIMVGWWYFF